MSKQHPAIKRAQRILKAAGLYTLRHGSLSLQVLAREYNDRPLIIDIRPDLWADDLARFSVSYLDSAHSEYSRAAAFDGIEFNF